ncbi:MAG: ornithine carbamoyltransferase [Clostridiales bacterium]|jgi:ornithine carbamoyltransferase|nr:ornithine carbamoyltransferase [Clostridiales bacterium]
MKKDFLKILDFNAEELNEIIDLGIELKSQNKKGIKHHLLEGKTLGLIFEKSSTRTRVSFEVGMYQLGGYPMFLSSNDMQLGRGESIQDTARVLARYVDGIMIRSFEQSKVELLAEYADIPVINGLTNEAHPCQIMADLMTVKEYKGDLKGLKAAFIGDGNNVCNSYAVAALKLGMEFVLSCPEGYEPHPAVLDFAKGKTNFKIVRKPEEAAKNADVVITDVWTSMGQELEQKKRLNDFSGYLVDEKLLALAKPGCIVQHCLPAHKGEEISEESFEKHAIEIFDEAENRLHVQKAIMVKFMK